MNKTAFLGSRCSALLGLSALVTQAVLQSDRALAQEMRKFRICTRRSYQPECTRAHQPQIVFLSAVQG